MGFTLVALVVGFGIALGTGGRLRHLRGRSFRAWPLLPAALLLQFALEADGVPIPFALLLVSYAMLLVFGVLNLRHTGMWLIVLGFALNGVVILVDHGMPVSHSALRSLHYQHRISEVKHHEQDAAGHRDRLLFLADIIPVPPIHQVLSFGDMVLSVGLVDLLFHLVRPVRRREDALEWGLERALPAAS